MRMVRSFTDSHSDEKSRLLPDPSEGFTLRTFPLRDRDCINDFSAPRDGGGGLQDLSKPQGRGDDAFLGLLIFLVAALLGLLGCKVYQDLREAEWAQPVPQQEERL